MKIIEPAVTNKNYKIWRLQKEGSDFYYEISSGHVWKIHLVYSPDETCVVLSSRPDTKDVLKIMGKQGVAALLSNKEDLG